MRELKVDLHTHTQFSDGTVLVDELVYDARRAGLDGVAVTDHDTLLHVDFVKRAQKYSPIMILDGLEVSAADLGRKSKAHILVYGSSKISPDGALAQMINETAEKRIEVARYQIASMQEAGISITEDKVRARGVCSAAIYKQAIMDALTQAPYGSVTYVELYDRYLGKEGKYYKQIIYPDVREVVEAARAEDAVPVLAHPGEYDNFDLVKELLDVGLQGLECYHPIHSEEDEIRALELAQKYNLVVTGGSDFHGDNAPSRYLGMCFTREDHFKRLIDLLDFDISKL